MTDTKEVEDMEKFMTILMEVKVSLADQNGKLDNLLDIKQKVDTTYDTANEAHRRSLENEKDIEKFDEKVNSKADKEDVKRIVKEKDNWQRNLPTWVAASLAAVSIILQYI